MVKRNKLEIVKDILTRIKENHNLIKSTPLLRKSNISTVRFKEYFEELLKNSFVKEVYIKNNKYISLTEKGNRFLEKYKNIIEFLDEFEL